MLRKHYEFIAVDFDGTLCEHKFPEIGQEKTKVIEYIKEQAAEGTKIILHTCREDGLEGNYLTEAVEWCKDKGIPIDAVNENPFVNFGHHKIYADIYIDDRSVNVKEIDPGRSLKHTFLKWGSIIIFSILLFKVGQALAYAQRGYRAIGGEIFLLFIPLFWKTIEICIKDILSNGKEGRENADMSNM